MTDQLDKQLKKGCGASVDLSAPKREGVSVIGVFIDAIDMGEAVERIIAWAKSKSSRYVCLCNVHSSVTASQRSTFLNTLSCSDIVLPDGVPVAWMMRRIGFPDQRRVAGPDLMLNVCDSAEVHGVSIFLYGSSEEILEQLVRNLHLKHPDLRIAGTLSPPFRDLNDDEERDIQSKINSSGAGIVFVALGCPRQEYWMQSQRGKIQAVMIGVGAAFNFHAGDIVRAPIWMQKTGVEWLHRLISEPRRLWKRYVITNTLFILRAMKDLLTKK